MDRDKEAIKLGKEVIDILDDILSVGDWSSSLFLKNSNAKIKDLCDRAKDICKVKVVFDKNAVVERRNDKVLPGYIRVFVSLYQVEGGNLKAWFRTIESLAEKTANKLAYKDEGHVQELVRSKAVNIGSNGYLIVDVKESDIGQEVDQKDAFDHELFSLKEKAIKKENMIEFVYANKKRYAVLDTELKILGEI